MRSPRLGYGPGPWEVEPWKQVHRGGAGLGEDVSSMLGRTCWSCCDGISRRVGRQSPDVGFAEMAEIGVSPAEVHVPRSVTWKPC